jgi:hypothetical protein
LSRESNTIKNKPKKKQNRVVIITNSIVFNAYLLSKLLILFISYDEQERFVFDDTGYEAGYKKTGGL